MIRGRGAQAEDLAARYLQARGLRVLARNYRCRGGEVDLVCEERGHLVFVEVRLRTEARFGGAGASITTAKRRRIALAASHFLADRPAMPCRFDAVLLDRLDAAGIEWIRDAFSTP